MEQSTTKKSNQKRRGNNQPKPRPLKMLVTVVNRNKTEFYLDLLQEFEVNLQLCMHAMGTAGNDILQKLGLAQTEKQVLIGLIREDRADDALQALEEKFRTVRGGKGIAYTVPLSGVCGVAIYQFLSNFRKNSLEQRQEESQS